MSLTGRIVFAVLTETTRDQLTKVNWELHWLHLVTCHIVTGRICTVANLWSAFTQKVILPTRCYAIAILAIIVCPSVCPSITNWCSAKTAKPGIMQTMPYDCPGTLVFWCQKLRRNSNGITPSGDDKQRWCRFRWAIFDQYLAISQKRCKIVP